MPLSEMVDVSSFLVNTDGKCWLSMLALVRLSDLSGTPLIWTACPQPRPVLPPGGRSPPQTVGATESPALWHRACWRHVETLGCPRVGHVCLRTHPTVVQHVVVDCMIHKAPDGFAGLRCPDAATRSWLKDLNIEI